MTPKSLVLSAITHAIAAPVHTAETASFWVNYVRVMVVAEITAGFVQRVVDVAPTSHQDHLSAWPLKLGSLTPPA